MADALINVLLDQLASVVFEHTKETVTLVLNAEEDVHNFSSSLKAIQAVLEDAEKKQVTEARVRDWLQKLKDVSYEMDDILGEWNYEILKQQVAEGHVTKKKVCFPIPSRCFCFGQVSKAIHHHNIATRIKDLNKKLDVIASEKDKYGFHLSTIRGTDERLIQHQKTSSLVNISTIFGREEEKKNLLSKLLRESNQDGGRFLVIPIVGMGGMGKTTLTQLIYNDEKVTNHYEKKVWVCVSDPFDEIKIAKAIIEGLRGNQSNSNELEILLQCIKSHVQSKKLLLVLDDVWTEDQKKWENLKLPVVMQSGTILVTTRKQEVANMMRATDNMIQLDKLNDEDCLDLFNCFAFSGREEDKADEFGAIGKKIVKKCKGLPLAAKTLGSLVWNKKTKEEWRDVMNSKIWELEKVEQDVFRPLLLSYYDLAPAVKMCLLYCTVFPKDYKFEKDNLIELWMSQDYLNSKEKKDKRKKGQNCFESLAMRSFFQDFEKDGLGNVWRCKMHDIVHDFVQFLTQKESIIIEGTQDAKQRSELSNDKVRHLTFISIPESSLSFPTSFPKCKYIRSLTILHSKITTISPGSLLEMKCLRTLNLSRNSLKEVPKEIGELIHLRYLDLSQNHELKELPESVCDLYNLQTLILEICGGLEKLPKGMGKLINLKHLYVKYCRRLRYLPKGIGSLKSLQVLDWFHVSDDEEALKLGDLRNMDQLQGNLEIFRLGCNAEDDASEIEKALLGNKEHLSHLGVLFGLRADREQRKGDEEIVKALQPHHNLESLSIYYCHATTESLYWIYSFHNLRRVLLGGWEYCELVPPLGKLPSLEILKIEKMKKVKKVGVEFLGIEEETETLSGILFPKLKQLHFERMPNWEEWGGMIKDSSQVTIMPRLSQLTIQYCGQLKALPEFLYKITTLRTLEIKECRILEGEYEKGVGKEWHNISHIPNIIIRRKSSHNELLCNLQ